MKTSWKKILEFAQVAQNYLANHPEKTKLEYAITRVMSQTAKIQEDVLERLNDVDIDCCLTEGNDENGAILRDDQGNLKFSKKSLRDRNKRRKEIMDNDDLEIEPYFATAIPDNLSDGEKEIFTGFVIKETPVLSLVADEPNDGGEKIS